MKKTTTTPARPTFIGAHAVELGGHVVEPGDMAPEGVDLDGLRSGNWSWPDEPESTTTIEEITP
jgi:hypothetical protein